MTTAQTMSDRIRRRLPAHTLERPFYTDDEFHGVDIDAIWHRQWIFVGHDISIPRAGDYFTVSVGDYPLIVVRGADNTVRALHNVCRHRGAQLCDMDSGSARRRIVCPYHQWSYELDGALGRARDVPDGFVAADHGLASAHCQVLESLVFVCVAETAPDFSGFREMTEPYLSAFDLSTALIAHSETVVEHGNWKLVMENNRECFHCRTAHPELCATFPEAPLHSGGASGEDLMAIESMIERCDTLGLPSRFVAAVDMQYRLMRMPLLGDARSMTSDGQPAVSRVFADLPDVNVGDVLLYHYPSTWNHFTADHAITFRILPIDATHTQLTTTWLVPAGSEPGVDFDVDELTSVWRATNAQDKALVERTQRGVSSPAYRPGPYAPIEEEGVIQFIDWYAAQLDVPVEFTADVTAHMVTKRS